MRQATPELRELARRLLAREAAKSRDARDPAGSMDGVCRQLYRRLDPLIGAGGFNALLGRALRIAGREFPWLDAVSVEDYPGCSLKGLAEAAGGRDEAEEGFAAVLANVVWLLVTFIGEDIALSVMREDWPEVGTGAAAPVSEKRKR